MNLCRPGRRADAVYVLAFGRRLPSEIPPLDQIRSRVTRDYQLSAATLLAWKPEQILSTRWPACPRTAGSRPFA